ncbi:MAG: hypothetical protein IKD05_08415 [Tidjanibacter sp.]|nr:hypothetical protein [Tidjanibacter sp.]MBR3682876.1 hypothetical protein [Tidjanibacter sp.]MBR3853516.1 hypothetical protein [Tidjanibacter sp.]MBR7130280.1 hypothetical protein [Tidjanibacter sp.]
MKQTEILERIGKQLPYTTPEGSHKELQQRILAATIGQRTAHSTTRTRGRKVALWGSGAVAVAAAAIALALVVGTPKPTAAEAFDQMLAQLTDEQCNALVASYSNDVFLWSIEE